MACTRTPLSCGRATAGAKPKLYNPRHPERTLLYQTIAEHFESWFTSSPIPAKAVAFIHRFGSSLNGHVHFHVCAVDGVFEKVTGQTDAQSSPPGTFTLLLGSVDRLHLRSFSAAVPDNDPVVRRILVMARSGFAL